ncbi:hypothetical protein EW026_g1586 [Hermanssonia centrifuga]|uniref:BRCA1-associated 2/ETP1 RRM domain-containing protein n=1 Tax=Hermanssonia centrifuga TaxID=98765 RepID=A0A4S4KR16_9APHY|nr:hypothetical protein EW026_g1586 [Hermanssonia centrifuga]
MHAEKEITPSQSSAATPSALISNAASGQSTITEGERVIDADGVMMGVLAVPSWMTPSDFLAFVAPAAEGMAHLRMIRDSAPNRSIVVIRFKEESDAAEFAEAYNGKQFNSMEPETCHVNKADGKLVELPSAASSMTMGGAASQRGEGGGPSAADALSAEKIEAIGIEYSYLLTSQLDSQRTYYETQTAELTTQVGELRSLIDRLSAEVSGGRVRMSEEETKHRKEVETRITEIEKAREKAERRAEKAVDLARQREKDYREELALSERLSKNLAAVQERAEKAEREREQLEGKVAELDDQLRDVMFFVEARSKIENGEGAVAEAAGGSLEVLSTPDRGAKKKKGKKK